MLRGTNELAITVGDHYAGCEVRKALLRDWARWAEVYTGTLKVLAKTWTQMPSDVELVVLKNAERALKRCQGLQSQFQGHIAKHRC